MISTLIAALAVAPAAADEGMWLPAQTPAFAEALAARGLQLGPDALSDPLQAPLSAIIRVGGCSASVVSADGLVATNHHCVQGALQHNSTAERDLHKLGHVARAPADELPAGPGAEALVLLRSEPVTAQVLAGIGPRVKDADRVRRMDENRARLVKACEAEAPDRRCSVVAHHGGQEHRLEAYRVFKDVRLVYAPPESVGSYGGEVDNWMWPRHAGDFALLRVYTAPDGASAPHAAGNVPWRPAYHLRVSTDGPREGALVLVAGYPGRTARLASAGTLRHWQEVGYPARVRNLEARLGVLRPMAAADPTAAARLAAPIGYLENSHKNARGMLENLRTGAGVAQKQAAEAAARAWAAADKTRARRILPALDELARIEAAEQAQALTDLELGALLSGSGLLGAAHTALRLADEAAKPDLQRDPGYQDRDRERIQARFRRIETSLHLPAEAEMLRLGLRGVVGLEGAQAATHVDRWVADHGGVEGAVAALMADPPLARVEARLALLEMDAAALRRSPDPLVQLAVALEADLAPRRAADRARDGARARLDPLRVEALQGAAGAPLYPDANGTLRVTWGTVKGFSPRDGVEYTAFTRGAGVAAKAGPPPFDAPERLLAALPAAPQSRWADPVLKDVPVDFLSDVDTTGGNSGSATLNGRGEVVGLLFDGIWEAMSGDWVYDPATNRSIHVDVRYLLWTLDAVEQAPALVDELVQGRRSSP
jgi:hypothetical protein